MPARSALWPSSVRMMWPRPEETATRASSRIRATASRRAMPGEPTESAGKVQSMTATCSPIVSSMRVYMPLVRTGLSRTKTFVCVASCARMLPRFLKRVRRLITRSSRSGSIGGLVTCAKFCRKKCDSGRCTSDRTARGLSSPIEPMASLPSSAMGERISSTSSIVKPAAY